MKRTLPAFALLFVGAATAQSGTIYKCNNPDGGTLISNSRVDKSCKPVVTGPDNTLPTPKAKSPTPAGFPKVGEDQQKARDTDRRRILEQELSSEQKVLEQSKKKLAEEESVRSGDEKNYQRVLDRLQPYKDDVAQHERNIEAITKELNNLR